MRFLILLFRHFIIFLVVILISGCATNALGQVPTEISDIEESTPTVDAAPLVQTELDENVNNPSPLLEPSPTTEEDPGTIYILSAGRVQLVDPVKKEVEQVMSLPTDIGSASISPNFEVMAYASSNLVYLVDLRNGEQIGSISGDPGEVVTLRGFNPNSTSSASQLLIRRESDGISTFNILTQGSDTSWQPIPDPPRSTHYGCDTGTAWSPNGDRILITGIGYGMGCNVNPGITMFSLRRGLTFSIQENQLSKGLSDNDTITAGARTPAWSVDGKSIFISIDDETVAPLQYTGRLYRLDENGELITPVTENPRGVAAYPLVLNDSVMLYSISGDSPQTDGIYIHNFANGDHILEEKGAGLCPLAINGENQLLLFGSICNENGSAYELRIKKLGDKSSISLARSIDGQPIQYLGWDQEK